MAFRACHSSSQKLCLVLLDQVPVLSMNLVITTMTLMMMVMVMKMMMMVVFIHQGHDCSQHVPGDKYHFTISLGQPCTFALDWVCCKGNAAAT